MDTVSVPARPRHLAGSDVANKVRRAGFLPAVLYGNGLPTQTIAVDPQPVKKGLQSAYGRNQLFELSLDGKQHLAVCKEVQTHPVSRALIHADFFTVTPASEIQVTVPVVLSGRSVGQKAGGKLIQVTRYLRIACSPTSLPKSIEIDVSPFDNGTAMTVESMPLPSGVKAVFAKPFKIFELLSPKAEEKAEGGGDPKKAAPAAKK